MTELWNDRVEADLITLPTIVSLYLKQMGQVL